MKATDWRMYDKSLNLPFRMEPETGKWLLVRGDSATKLGTEDNAGCCCSGHITVLQPETGNKIPRCYVTIYFPIDSSENG